MAEQSLSSQAAWDALTASTPPAPVVTSNATVGAAVTATATSQVNSSSNNDLVAASSSLNCGSPPPPSTPTKSSPQETAAHTPQGPPSSVSHTASVGFGEELPTHMVNLGWRKFWSKRENRPYYWNKATGESLWDIPGNQGKEFDPLTDPLGICHPGASNGELLFVLHFDDYNLEINNDLFVL